MVEADVGVVNGDARSRSFRSSLARLCNYLFAALLEHSLADDGTGAFEQIARLCWGWLLFDYGLAKHLAPDFLDVYMRFCAHHV